MDYLDIGQQLIEAIEKNDLRRVRQIIQLNPTALSLPLDNLSPDQPLHYACLQCRPEIVQFLLQQHAEVNVRGYQGRTPLYHAVDEGDAQSLEIVKMLIEAGADPNIKEDLGMTPLDRALVYSHPELESSIQYLLAHGARMTAIAGVFRADVETLKRLLQEDGGATPSDILEILAGGPTATNRPDIAKAIHAELARRRSQQSDSGTEKGPLLI